MQDILWQIVDETLRRLRLQFFADLDAYWDARTIYQAQVQAQQVPDATPCTQSTAQHKSSCIWCNSIQLHCMSSLLKWVKASAQTFSLGLAACFNAQLQFDMANFFLFHDMPCEVVFAKGCFACSIGLSCYL